MMNIVLLGPPGAGKGTQSEKIRQRYHLTSITPGNLMREHISQGSELGKLLARYIDEGQLAPHAVAMQLVERELEAHPNTTGFLFDGFPRALDQATGLEALLLKYGLKLDSALFLEVSEEEVKKRIQGRSQIAKRTDDNKVVTRLQIYQQETLPVRRFYEKDHKLFKIDGLGTPEHVFERIVKVLDPVFKHQS